MIEERRRDPPSSDVRLREENSRAKTEGEGRFRREHYVEVEIHPVRYGISTHRPLKGTPTWRATVDEIWSVVYLGVCPR